MRTFLPLAIALFALATSAIIPAAPNMRKTLTFDGAKLISASGRTHIQACQVPAFKDQDVAIVVATISSMGRYIEGSHDIKNFAGKWFAKWRVGKEGNGRGVLFLVSRHDRKVRIELGRDWGGQWDPHCTRILNTHVLPAFKTGNYSGGITKGVRELTAMAAIGPAGQAPAVSVRSGFVDGDLLGAANRSNPIPMSYRIWVLGLGVLLCLIGICQGRRGLALFGAGALVICSAYAFWAAICILFVVLFIVNSLNDRYEYYDCGGRRRRRRRYSSCDSSSSSSSGGSWSCGGFSSSGGGASGSW
jgi:uncharacterized membrane protein YgcG